jgi:hypothetical protein
MDDDRESDADLLARHKRVSKLYADASKRASRMKTGGNRDRALRFAGCLNFTKLQCESEIETRGLRCLS